MHWIYNERLFDPGPDLTYYDTHAAWRQHRRDWFKHQATDVERRVIRYHIDRVARSAEGKQRWLEARCDEHRRVEHAEGEDAEAS
jgi:hypothetical protein